VWQLVGRPDDGPLRNGKCPKLPISIYFASAHEDVKGFFVPVLYGVHNSNGAGTKGFVPLYLVDTVASKYVLGQGRCNALHAVYDEEGAVISSGAYTFAKEVIKGAVFSTVTFSGGRTEPVLYADAEGLTANADGTGSLITNPANQISHFLHNFAWGDWRNGAFVSSAPVNTGAIVTLASYMTAMGHEGSFWFGGPDQSLGIDIVNKFLVSHGVYAFWSHLGQITFKALDHRPPSDVYPTDPWIEGDTDSLGSFDTPFDPEVIVKGVDVAYVVDHARGGESKNTLRVADKSVQEDVLDDLDLSWSAGRVV
jgi:hypothetical protein